MASKSGPGTLQAVQRTGADERFQTLLVEACGVHPAAEVEERCKRAILQRAPAGSPPPAAGPRSLYRKAEADGRVFDGAGLVASIDIGRQDRDADAFGLHLDLKEFVLVPDVGGEVCSQVFERIVRLQLGALVGNMAVHCRMRLVEPVSRELGHEVENFDAIASLMWRQRALNELLPHLLHNVELLLAHCLAQDIGFAKRKAANALRDAHHLFLVDDHPVGHIEYLAELRMEVVHLLLPVLAADEGIDVVHGPRPVEGHHGDDILDIGRFQLPEVVLHALRVELEYADGLTFAEKLVGLFIVVRDMPEVNGLPMVTGDEPEASLWSTVSVRSPRKSILISAHLFHIVHIELGHHDVGAGLLEAASSPPHREL